MRELKIGERIPIEAGGEAVVSRELGRGGQGIVYLVRYNGREYALKWYFISRIKNPEAFRNNLRKNIEDGAPEGGKQFIWPLFLTETKKNGAFGYLMRLAPSGYESFTDIYNGYRWEKPRVKGQPARKIKVKFASLDVMLTAAINIAISLMIGFIPKQFRGRLPSATAFMRCIFNLWQSPFCKVSPDNCSNRL